MKSSLLPLLLGLCLLPKPSQAIEIKSVSVDLATFNFVNDRGEGKARDAYIEIGDISRAAGPTNRKPIPQSVYLYRQGDDVQIETGFATLAWHKVPQWMTVDLDLAATDMKLKLGYAPSHEITAKSITVSKPSIGVAKVTDLKVLCTPLAGEAAQFEKILAQCLNNSVITAAEMDIPTLKELWADALDDQNFNAVDMQRVAGELNIKINKGIFNFVVKNKVLALPAHIRGTGQIQLSDKNVARVRIDQVYFGKLNITRFVLPMASVLLSGPEFKVQAPYIYIQL